MHFIYRTVNHYFAKIFSLILPGAQPLGKIKEINMMKTLAPLNFIWFYRGPTPPGCTQRGLNITPVINALQMLNICSLQNAFLASSRGHFIEAVWGHFLLQNALLECFFCNHRKAFYRRRRCSLRYLTSQLVSHFVVTCRFRIIIYHNPGRSIL